MSDIKNNNTALNTLKGIVFSFVLFGLTQGIAFLFSPKGSPKLHYIAFLILAIQWIGFTFSSGIFGNKPTEKYYDITGSVTYIATLTISYFTLEKPSKRQFISSSFALIWATRLGWFLFSRVSRNGGIDDRFEKIKSNLSDFLIAWTLQGVWIFITLLSILALCQMEDSSELSLINYIGIFVWICGFLIEVTADHQKYVFKSDPSNKGKWISTGLWSLSRHPNYFGEIVMWCGISMICACKSIKPVKLLLSPLFVAFLLIFISGIPILEKKADSLYSADEKYIQFKKTTPVLIPIVGRAGNSMF